MTTPTPLASLPTWILSSAATRAHQILHDRLSRTGFTGYEYRCLIALASTEQLSQTHLSDAAVLDPRDVTHTIRALEDRGLVLRVRDPSHGRRMLVSLTPAGRQSVGALDTAMAQVQEDAFGRLAPEELSCLLELLQRVGSPA